MLQTLRVQYGERYGGEGFKFNCAHDIPEPEAIKFAADHKILPIFVKSGQKKYVSGAIDWLNKQTRRNVKFMFYPLDYLFQQLVTTMTQDIKMTLGAAEAHLSRDIYLYMSSISCKYV